MNVRGFISASLGSNPVQLHDSLASRHTCACSGVSFISQNGDRAWGVYYQRAVFCCAFLWATCSMQRIFINKYFLFSMGSVFHAVLFKTGSINSLRTFESHRWCCAAGRRVDLNWQKDTDRQCNNGNTVFPWFSIEHNYWSFKVPERVCTVSA
jgi:hypothetical protein